MQIVIWIVIILLAIFLIWLLKKWIKRIIFILILLALAFFIYGIFNPSWAARLWYNVRTFPQRVTSWISSGKEFLDYDNYKSKISSIWDSIGDKVESLGDGIENLGDKIDIDVIPSESEKEIGLKDEEKAVEKNTEKEDSSQLLPEQTIKSFPKSVDFVEIRSINQWKRAENFWPFTWYSKLDLLWIINKYIEKNLDDDTDIFVTVEYEEWKANPQKIILETRAKSKNTVSNYNNLVDKKALHWSNSEEIGVDIDENKVVDKQVENKVNYTSTKLTQKEKKETEEIFSILF